MPDKQVIDQIVAEVTERLRRTQDAVAPAVRENEEAQRTRWIAISSTKLNFILGPCLFLTIALNCALGYWLAHVRPDYFASDNGRIIKLVPLGAPYRKPADVIQFARDTLNQTFTLDFQNWRSQLEATRPRYTREGFKSMLASMTESDILGTVKNRRMNMSVTAGTGVIIKDGIENGVYVWIVQMPVEVKLAGQTSEMPPQKFLATVRVERTSTLDSLEGIATAQTITRPL